MNENCNAQGKRLTPGAGDELRLRVLRVLEIKPELSQRQLAVELGVSVGAVNYALKALVETGFVKAKNFRKSSRKAGYLYLLTPKGVAEKTALAVVFLGRKLEEYEVLRGEIESLRAELNMRDSDSESAS